MKRVCFPAAVCQKFNLINLKPVDITVYMIVCHGLGLFIMELYED
ncbi:hypothetical protein SAMN05216326_10672 [Nitrosomonas marina]|uniref:Uncharacterized protein n=1 Tax=Nitrosomonas marina TaxID=917 RepID=A0A1I0A8P4_9PROT|nr:hypothetical protein SAMN05216326_10672 [Nitrosomonas marina]